ncbi:MAG: hypothetical protein HQL38_17330 [Alphaproteobacteria bacterium]|nr:hypothetical protein [Alphaproteobacteria bacterium]
MHHTFLLEEGVWRASGTYTDEAGATHPIRGRAAISHALHVWRNEGEMEVMGDEPVVVDHLYEIVPMPHGASATIWTASSARLGRLRGNVAVVGDTLLSSFTSEEGEFSGTESLTRLGDNAYAARGVLYRGFERLSSWSMQMTRVLN